MAKKHSVSVTIGGEEYTLRADVRPEYTRDVAAYVDQALNFVLENSPLIETHKAPILAALAITDELFQARQTNEELTARLEALTDDFSRLLPPSKRGTSTHHT